MITIVNEQFGHVPDAATFASEAQLELVIGGIQKVLVAVPAEAVIGSPAHEQRLVADVIYGVKQHVVVVNRLFALINLASLGIHKNDVAEQGIPIRISLKGLGYFAQSAGPETIIGVEDHDHVARGSANPFVHRMIMAFILLGDPNQVRVALEHADRSILRAAIDNDMFP